MSEIGGGANPPPPMPATVPSESSKSCGDDGFDSSQIVKVKAWLISEFDAVGKDVPDFEYTPQSIALLHNIATFSQARTKAASTITNDFRQKALEYHSQALHSLARLRQVLEDEGLVKESLPANVVSSAQVLASAVLNIRDTELTMADLSLRKTAVEEKRTKVQQESKELLDYTRKLVDDMAPCEAQMDHWKTNLGIMDSKQRQYFQQYSNYKAALHRVGYSSEISHRVSAEMAEHWKELEKKAKPILDTLRSYHDLPPDKALAIEDKKRQYATTEKYLEDVLQSALDSTY